MPEMAIYLCDVLIIGDQISSGTYLFSDRLWSKKNTLSSPVCDTVGPISF